MSKEVKPKYNWEIRKSTTGAMFLINKDRQVTASDQLYLGNFGSVKKEQKYDVDIVIKIKGKKE